MARILILDGYNIIGARGAMRQDRDLLSRERQGLVREVSGWAVGRDFPEVYLVFDGYPTDRDLLLVGASPVRVVFSEKAANADAVIVGLARRFRERALVVSSDREVVRDVRGEGAETVSAKDFAQRLARHAFSSSFDKGSKSLPEEAIDKDAEEAPLPTFGKKRGNPRRLSRKDRAQRRLLDKL